MTEHDLRQLFAAMEPDPYQETRLQAAVREGGARKRGRGLRLRPLALAGCAALAAGLISCLPGLGRTGYSPPAAEPGPAPLPAATQAVSHTLTMRIHLDDGTGAAPSLTGGTLVEEGVALRMGTRRIQRGALGTFEENGTPVSRYGVYGLGEGAFLTIDGTDIARVRIRAVNGAINYTTEAWMRAHDALHGQGEALGSFTVPAGTFPADSMAAYALLRGQWKNGVYDDVLDRLLGSRGLSYDIGHYVVKIVSGTDEDTVFLRLGKSGGQDITVDYAKEGRLLRADWDDRQAVEEVSRYPAVPYEELTGDTLTIDVTFTDGSTVTKTIGLSYDSEGYLLARLNG